MKVETFSDSSLLVVKEQINKFLEKNKEKIELINIRFTTGLDYHYALLIYEEVVSGKRMKSIGREVTVGDVLDRCFKLEGRILELDGQIIELNSRIDNLSPGSTFVGG